MRISHDVVTSINGYQAKKCSCGAEWTVLKRDGTFIRVCTNPDCTLRITLPIQNWHEIKKEEIPEPSKEEVREGFE
jgi:hypothetical protein